MCAAHVFNADGHVVAFAGFTVVRDAHERHYDAGHARGVVDQIFALSSVVLVGAAGVRASVERVVADPAVHFIVTGAAQQAIVGATTKQLYGDRERRRAERSTVRRYDIGLRPGANERSLYGGGANVGLAIAREIDPRKFALGTEVNLVRPVTA